MFRLPAAYLGVSGSAGALVLGTQFTGTSPGETDRAAALGPEQRARQVGLTLTVAHLGPAGALPVVCGRHQNGASLVVTVYPLKEHGCIYVVYLQSEVAML